MKQLVLVRHGLSEANVVQSASNGGDDSLHTEDVVNYPDRSWRLTPTGVEQAQVTGEYLRGLGLSGFDKMVSPYSRTRETAAHLGLAGMWQENRSIRERYWGEIASLTRKRFEEQYPTNAHLKEVDPLYWTPPSGESIAAIAEGRVRNFLKNFHNGDGSLLAVTHGDFMWVTRLVMEGWSDNEFLANSDNPDLKIHNCAVIHYTLPDPDDVGSGTVQVSYPVETGNGWQMREGAVEDFSYSTPLTGDELLVLAQGTHRHF